MEFVRTALEVLQVVDFLALVYLLGYGACLLDESNRDLKRAIKVRNESVARTAALIEKDKQERESRVKEIEKDHVNATV